MKSSYYPAPTGDEKNTSSAAATPSTAADSSSASASAASASTPKTARVSSAFYSATAYLASKMRCQGKGTLDDELLADFNSSNEGIQQLEDTKPVATRRHTQ